MMKFFQKLGKPLMLPVACLPVCGILMGIGYILAPAAMAGEVQGFTAGGLAYSIGLFLIKAGGALIDNMSWLFAVGVAVGMADDSDGTAGLAGLVSMYMITTLLSPGAVAGITGHEAAPAFGKIINQFVGILSGLIGSACYNKYKTVKLPDALAFFSGKRAVAIFTAIYSIVAALVLFVVWPLVYGGLVALGEAFIGMGAVGAGIYAFFNRLLIPFGLHHALNSVFWFDVAGISDLSNFWGNTGVYGQTGMYMTGFFPFMMFGLPAACIAMYQTAKPGKKKIVYGLLASAAFCSFFTGVTEPIEFSFMFLAPGLYVVHALLAGITAGITVALPIRAGFSFSGGAVDMVLSSFTPLAENPWLLIPVGLAVGVLYYVVFRFAIAKFNLKTPGREDDDTETKLYTKADVNARKEAGKETAGNTGTADPVSEAITQGLGGKKNISDVDCCATRLRITVHDASRVNDEIIKTTGSRGIVKKGQGVQIIYGPQVTVIKSKLEDYLETAPDEYYESAAVSEENSAEENTDTVNENNKTREKVVNTIVVSSPITGMAGDITTCPDEGFAGKMMGDGAVVTPEDAVICAPEDGEVLFVFETKHALGFQTESGLGMLLHIGIDTVSLNGEGFEVFVENGQKVKKGDPLMKIDIPFLASHAPSLCSPVLCTELGDNQKVRLLKEGEIKAGEPLFAVDVYEA